MRCAATYAMASAGALGPSAEGLLALTALGARKRLLSAMGGPDPGRGVERERRRGECALASLARVGVAAATLDEARASFQAFVVREAAGVRVATPAFAHPLAEWVPRRRVPAPLHYQRFLLPGWGALSREEREAWRRHELDMPDGELLADLGWMACDGARTLREIARLVWLETGHEATGFLAGWFGWAARLGLADAPPAIADGRGGDA